MFGNANPPFSFVTVVPSLVFFDALVSVTVITTGLLDSSDGRAEAIAVLGFFGYALYLLTSAAAVYLMTRLEAATWWRFGIWLVIGLVFYFGYARRHSRLEA